MNKKMFYYLCHNFCSLSGTTVLDKMSHTIITALTCVDSPRTKNQQLENALRKLSSKHPILVLRQLPLIANSLLGEY